jgi:hypothetical protein
MAAELRRRNQNGPGALIALSGRGRASSQDTPLLHAARYRAIATSGQAEKKKPPAIASGQVMGGNAQEGQGHR